MFLRIGVRKPSDSKTSLPLDSNNFFRFWSLSRFHSFPMRFRICGSFPIGWHETRYAQVLMAASGILICMLWLVSNCWTCFVFIRKTPEKMSKTLLRHRQTPKLWGLMPTITFTGVLDAKLKTRPMVTMRCQRCHDCHGEGSWREFSLGAWVSAWTMWPWRFEKRNNLEWKMFGIKSLDDNPWSCVVGSCQRTAGVVNWTGHGGSSNDYKRSQD